IRGRVGSPGRLSLGEWRPRGSARRPRSRPRAPAADRDARAGARAGDHGPDPDAGGLLQRGRAPGGGRDPPGGVPRTGGGRGGPGRARPNLATILYVEGRREEAVRVSEAGIAAAEAAGLEAVHGNRLRGGAVDSL